MAYLGVHAIQGKYGLAAFQAVRAEEARLAAEADRLAKQRAALEADIELMQPDRLDPDWLALAARQQLGYVHEDEVLVLTPPSQP